MTDIAAAPAATRYAVLQRVLHWVLAILVLCSLTGGAILWAYGYEGLVNAFGQAATNTLYKYHKTAGVLILGLMVVRVALRRAFGAPAFEPMAPVKAMAARATHFALYALLVAMPVVGWLGTGAGGFPVEFFDMKLPGFLSKDPALSEWLFELHGWLGLAIVVVLAVHVGAALHHWLVLKDGVMRRMSLP